MTQDKPNQQFLAPIGAHRASVSYSPVRNRLAEQEKSPLNQTYTIGQRTPRARSNSIDSDVVEYTIQGAIAGRLPQARSGKSSQSWTNRSVRNKTTTMNSNCSLARVFSSKLPTLEGVTQNRNCCQKYWTKTQIELSKYKATLSGK